MSSPSPPLDDFRLGVIIGLALSFRNLLSKLPDAKPAFLFNILALNYMLGGYQFGKTKMLAAFLMNVFCRSLELLIDKFWDAFGESISEGAATVTAIVADASSAAREPPVREVPAPSGWLKNLAGKLRM